ncbi:NAD(P)/FAD-dependent oxidoreductase [Streptomyces candidus]|uniref:3-phenylpropionate/trans-cinnamate dioxygenase ferredoxin reductase subunit n=1 Tax=Streptomyces candidus TaxID=67283 RepID=A0A7X0HFR9_9ACTN|nr:FAD-dependent oxidoreductase [Streptomyces candidus]MBB6436683.1 3-phenylpropionate/trans-cinnamate dioxygenase ferredoxin reductase subunit [Streptomyces candidus]GHH51051.1 pyridine nucleotide-disulfide oxidoreductase [Streptomyces candidus]
MGRPTVVVVGAGQAGAEAAVALRAQGYGGRVVLVGEESETPYQRPPLSKELLAAGGERVDCALYPASHYPDRDIELLSGERAEGIDREGRTLLLASGRELPYDALVLATGARPRALTVPGAGLAGVHTLRTLSDARDLRSRLYGARDLVVVGGGFIGLEVASAARTLGLDVAVVEVRDRLMGRSVSEPVSRHLAELHRRNGVRVLLAREVTAVHGEERRVREVELDGGERIAADVVVAGIGAVPNTEIAARAGLAVDDGILVDARLRTSDPAVLAIGDCARFPSRHGLGRHAPVRLESVQNAADQARAAATTVCDPEGGADYDAVPWFWTHQYGVRLQIAGLTAGHDRTVTVGDPAGGRFSVFCFRGERLLGVESVGRPADHAITRRLLAGSRHSLTPESVAAPGFDLKQQQLQSQPA